MSETKHSPLLPCPFCGRLPHKKLGKKNDDGLQDLIISCPALHARISCINHEAAVEEWNTRSPAVLAKVKPNLEGPRGLTSEAGLCCCLWP